MESNVTDQQYFGADLQLSEPHFDEEATLLSARRVVPLGDVRPQARSGTRLAFGLSIVLAVMAGAFGASIIYKQRGQKQATAIVETGSRNPEPVVPDGQSLSSVSGGTTSDLHASASSTSEDIEDLVTGDGRKNAAATKARKPTPPFSQSAKSGQANETWQDGAGNLGDEKELRRFERIEARRLKRNAEREARREARGQKSRASDDLWRIREIFEGSPRP
ncbi:MAG TPA: hypothetical protein VGJ66_08590 [Pyrinomonadaceae bacterium]|jgi:hypothetical protein